MPKGNRPQPRRIVEGWYLDDIEDTHARHPDTFHIPSLEERRGLAIGRSVRLHFVFDEPMEDGCTAERMWVTITEKRGTDEFRGSLENEPAYIKSLSAGDTISFKVCHIAQILIPKGDPQWVDTTK